jgi:hypothetical protein
MKPEKLGLPPRQLSAILGVNEQALHQQYLYHEGRDIGIRKKDEMACRNIAPADSKPEWRVAETELIRWMRVKGFKFYNRGTVVK